MNTHAAPEVALIGLDWGTTSLRAFRYGAEGEVLERRQSAHGITQLPLAGEPGFIQALTDIAGDWLRAAPQAPVLACGMVGSAQGWREAAYVEIPTSLAQLSSLCLPVDPACEGQTDAERSLLARRDILILPGLIERGPAPALPNVMRGEETQIFGSLQDHDAPDDLIVLLPGSHSKWVTVQDTVIRHFETFMTGEVFAALRAHTILGRTMAEPPHFNEAAFLRGVHVAQGEAGAKGVLNIIFSTRTLGLEGRLTPQAQPDYLSGLLIGHEVRMACEPLRKRTDVTQQAIWLIGSTELCTRYVLALQAMGVTHCRVLPQATERGLWHLAQARGLVCPAQA